MTFLLILLGAVVLACGMTAADLARHAPKDGD